MSENIEDFGAIGLDQIEDVPGFKVPPPGSYDVDAECEIKVLKSRPYFIVNFTVTQPDGEGYLKGDKFGVSYNSDGMAYNKPVIAQIYQAFGGSNPKQCVEAGTIQAQVTIKHRADKNDPEKVYCELKMIKAA